MQLMTIEEQFQQAVADHKAGKFPEAERGYKIVLQGQPNHVDAYHNMGALAMQYRKFDIAIRYFNQVLTLNDTRPQFWISAIHAYMEAGLLEEAKSVVQKARIKGLRGPKIDEFSTKLGMPIPTNATQDASSANIAEHELTSDWYEQAIALREKGKFQQAKQLLTLVIERESQNTKAHALYAHICLLLNDPDNAVKALIEGQKYVPNDPLLQCNLARVATRYQQSAKALEHAKNAFDSDPHNREYRLVYAFSLYSSGQKDEAMQELKTILAHETSYAEAELTYATWLQEQKLYDEALAAYDRALALKPHLVRGWCHKSHLLLKEKNDRLGAIHCLEQALIADSNHIESLIALGELYRQQEKQWPRAKELLIRALKINAEHPDALLNYAVLSHEQGDMELASILYRRLLGKKPDHFSVLANLGVLMAQQDRHERAMEYLERALAINPGYQIVIHNLLKVLYHGGYYQKLVSLIDQYEPTMSEDVKFLCMACLSALAQRDWQRVDHYYSQIQAKPYDSAVNEYQYLKGFLSGLLHNNRTDLRLRYLTDLKRSTEHYYAQPTQPQKPQIPMTIFISLGRAGSMFFHSLWDQHPEVSTLPGLYFKGWFSSDANTCFRIDYNDPQWRQAWVNRFIYEYEPVFDAHSKRNVIGRPMGEANWLASASGFCSMGPNSDQIWTLDREAFRTRLLALMRPYDRLDHISAFELVHQAYDQVLAAKDIAAKKHIFYHLHLPDEQGLATLAQHHTQCRLLYIIRHPLQNLESWMLISLNPEQQTIEKINHYEEAERKILLQEYYLASWNKAIDRMRGFFSDILCPIHETHEAKIIRLEDVKTDPHRWMALIAAWMGVEDDPHLYESTFGGQLYQGPHTVTEKKVTGFELTSIQQPLGRLFGPRDLIILETLLWPIMSVYGYSTWDEETFRQNLAKIRPWLDEPFEYERTLYSRLPDSTIPLESLASYIKMHHFLKMKWEVLMRDGTYVGIISMLDWEQKNIELSA
jgi:tetratricopeptide (TPR) repeat protein